MARWARRAPAARCGNARRGAILLLPLIITVATTGLMLHLSAAYFENRESERARETRMNLRDANIALRQYMLTRAESDLRIAQGSKGYSRPRWLQLPCPDNVSDGNLDGSQEGSCNSHVSFSNKVNNILDTGSRFGFFPWRSRQVYGSNNTANDGVDITNARDAAGDRFWYALSRNMAPVASGYETGKDKVPMNLHRLATLDNNEWLSVVNAQGVVMREKVAAVILSPGKALMPRYGEAFLSGTTTLSHNADVAAGALSPHRYFESHSVTINGALETVQNYSKNGEFILPPFNATAFNDNISYISIEGLLRDKKFIRAYSRLIGAQDTHNAPLAGRPLKYIAEGLRAHHNLLGFFPPPARLNDAAHVNTRARHCLAFNSGGGALAAALPVGAVVAAANPITVYGVDSTNTITVTPAAPEAFLLQAPTTVTTAAPANILYSDAAQDVSAITLARYARLIMRASLMISKSELTPAGVAYVLPAGIVATMAATTTITISPRQPLQPVGDLHGWLPESTRAYQAANLTTYAIQTDTRAAFFGDNQRLENGAAVITLGRADALSLAAGSRLRLEDDVAGRDSLSGAVTYADGRRETLAGAVATERAYNKRQFAAWLLADAVATNRRIEAPALVFPWRKEIKSNDPDSRDNLHDYPPCFDSRNLGGAKVETAMQDQTMYYAVAAACHYGGDPRICGKSAGFTVRVAAGARVALANPLTLTQTYAARIGNFFALTLINGAPQTPAVLQKAASFPLMAGGITLAAFRLPAKYRFTPGAPMVLPAGATLVAGANTVFENVPALLIYSPAPLPRVACARNMAAAARAGILNLLNSPPIALANQQTDTTKTNDLTNLCYWIDDEENADEDGDFVIYGKETRRTISPRNDYFVLLGGQPRFN